MKSHPTIIRVLLEAMRTARTYDVSFNACMQQARLNEEVRQQANETLLPNRQ